MGFNSISEMAQAWQTGRVWSQAIHKTSLPITSAGFWSDLSMAAGTPKYNAYVGAQYEFTPMAGTSNFGVNTGGPGIKYLSRIMIQGDTPGSYGALPGNILICDYVGFYPLIDMDMTDYQEMVNPVTVPRHVAGGLQLIVVCTTPQAVAGTIACQVVYDNQDDRENIATFYLQSAGIANINVTSGALAGSGSVSSPFVPLGPGDHSIKRVKGVQLAGGAGGFCAFVLVKPICDLFVTCGATPTELDLVMHRQPIPEILDNAYINILFSPLGPITTNRATRGQFEFIRS